MTKVDTTTPTADDVLDAVHELAPEIAARAPEIEAARRVPADLLGQLIDAGCFQLLRPRSLGGIGADVPAALEVFEALARADASTGWVAMIGGGSWIDPPRILRSAYRSRNFPIYRGPTVGFRVARTLD